MKKKWILTGLVCLAFLTACEGADEKITRNEVPFLEDMVVSSGDQDKDLEVGTDETQTEEETAAGSMSETLNGDNATDVPESELPIEEGTESGRISITISGAGDVTLGNYIGQGYTLSFRDVWETEKNPAYFFENVSEIFGADNLTIVNLEGPLTRSEAHREDQTYCISGDPEYAEALPEGNIEAVTISNNHSRDYLEAGREDTIQALEDNGILYASEKHPVMCEVRGVKIGLIAVNVLDYGGSSEKLMKSCIETLKEQGADLIVANCHWGIEREYVANQGQQNLGHRLIEAGCDLVLGHHPHVIQGIEKYNGKYIVYSLGNFCFGGNKNPADKDCFIFQQTFYFDKEENSDTIVLADETKVRVIPCLVSSTTARNDFKPTPQEGERAQNILDKIRESSGAYGTQIDGEGYLDIEMP